MKFELHVNKYFCQVVTNCTQTATDTRNYTCTCNAFTSTRGLLTGSGWVSSLLLFESIVHNRWVSCFIFHSVLYQSIQLPFFIFSLSSSSLIFTFLSSTNSSHGAGIPISKWTLLSILGVVSIGKEMRDKYKIFIGLPSSPFK